MGTSRPPVLLAALFGLGLGVVAPLSARTQEPSAALPLARTPVPETRIPAPGPAVTPASRNDMRVVVSSAETAK